MYIRVVIRAEVYKLNLSFLVWHWFVDKKVLEVDQVAVTAPLVVMEAHSAEAAWEIKLRLEPAQEVTVQLQPVEAVEAGERGRVYLGDLTLAQIQTLEILQLSSLLGH